MVRDNNRHASGDKSDYMIVDIEYAQSPAAFPEQKYNFRFDMVGLRWPVEGGGRGSGAVTPVIMEMKTGDAALASHPAGPEGKDLSPGLAKHVRDIESFLAPDQGCATSGPYELLRSELRRTFGVKQRLGLPSVPERMKRLEITEMTQKLEVLFVIANHQPKSKAFGEELLRLPAREHADYYVATVEWMGYALFAENMQSLDEFVENAAL